MHLYSLLREFADSWGLLAMVLFFFGVCALTLSRSRDLHDDAARTPFRHDRPADLDRAKTERPAHD